MPNLIKEGTSMFDIGFNIASPSNSINLLTVIGAILEPQWEWVTYVLNFMKRDSHNSLKVALNRIHNLFQ